QLPRVEVAAAQLMSGTTDSSDPYGTTAFTSHTQDRITVTSVPLIEPAHVMALPKGQAFALLEGGNLWKIRMPLPAPDPDEIMPEDLQALAAHMRRHYAESSEWWNAHASVPPSPEMPLPEAQLAAPSAPVAAADGDASQGHAHV